MDPIVRHKVAVNNSSRPMKSPPVISARGFATLLSSRTLVHNAGTMGSNKRKMESERGAVLGE